MTYPHILVANIFFAPFTYGGATVVAEEVARDLARRKAARITAVSLISKPELPAYGLTRSHCDGIDNYLINVPHNRDYKAVYDDPKVEQALCGLIEMLSPDLLHAHCIQEMGTGALRAAKQTGLPIVLSVHDYWWICERQFMIRMDEKYCGQNPVRIENCRGCVADWGAANTRFQSLSQAAEMADVITYPSHFALELCENSGLAPGRGQVWENGVHLPGPEFADLQAKRQAQDDRIVFGFVGGPSQIKGWPLIRSAFKQLKRSDFHVLLVDGSKDGSWWRGHDFSELPGTWEVYPRFDQSRMDRFYARIDVLLFLSQWKETFGLTIREALARGIGVIQTDSGGSTEHPAADPDRLIPIGTGPEPLTAAVEKVLQAGARASMANAVPVTGFSEQARAFEKITGGLFATG